MNVENTHTLKNAMAKIGQPLTESSGQTTALSETAAAKLKESGYQIVPSGTGTSRVLEPLNG